jgi:hypothetical protein
MNGRLRVEVVVVEFVVFALDMEWAEMNGPVTGLIHYNTETPIVQGQVGTKLLSADNHAQHGPIPLQVSACFALDRQCYEREGQSEADRITVPPNAEREIAEAKREADLPATYLPLDVFLRNPHAGHAAIKSAVTTSRSTR